MTPGRLPAGGGPPDISPDVVDVDPSEPPSPPRSVLLAALRWMPGTWRAAVPAIVVTAAVQAGLMYVDDQSGLTAAFVLSFLVSALATLVLYAVLTACALEAVDRAADRAAGGARTTVAERLRAHPVTFVGWVLLQWAAILLLGVVNPLLVAVLAVLTPFVPLAAMDGRGNALGANLHVIGQRLGRWLFTSGVLLLLGLLLFLGSVANTLFVKGTPAAALFWLVIGLVAWWILTAWAVAYRSVPAGTASS